MLPDSCDFTVFGGTGDLALPQAAAVAVPPRPRGQLPADYRILGVSRSDLDDAGWRAEVRDRRSRSHVNAGRPVTTAQSTGFLARLFHLKPGRRGPED